MYLASITSIVVPCVLDSCRVQRYRGIYSSILGVEVIGILNCLWDSLERLCHCHWGNWCFSELDERFLLSIETLIPKELSQMCLCPPNAKVFFKVDCERLCGFYWKGKVWGSSISGQILNACRSGRRFPKTVIQEPPFWKDSFLCGTVHLNI